MKNPQLPSNVAAAIEILTQSGGGETFVYGKSLCDTGVISQYYVSVTLCENMYGTLERSVIITELSSDS